MTLCCGKATPKKTAAEQVLRCLRWAAMCFWRPAAWAHALCAYQQLTRAWAVGHSGCPGTCSRHMDHPAASAQAAGDLRAYVHESRRRDTRSLQWGLHCGW